MTTELDDLTLEDFALKGLQLAKMTGVTLAVHAVSDAFLLMHTGVGCKYKAGVQVSGHDWVRHPNQHEAWTQVGEMSLIKGAGERIGPFARSYWDRRRPGIMVLVSAYFLELIGDDIASFADDAEETIPCPLVRVGTEAPNKGFFGGYANTQYGMLAKLPFKTNPATAPKQATVVGAFFSRYEQDCLADTAQLKRLIKATGLAPGPVFFSGRPWSELKEGWRSKHVIELPYMRPVRTKLKRLMKNRNVVRTDLPMGLAGTRRWLVEVAKSAGGNVPLAEAFAKREAARARAAMDIVSGPMSDLRIVVFADTPYAAGLVTILSEMGLNIAFVGLRDTSLGGADEFHAILARNGVALENTEVVETPSLHWLSTEGRARVKRIEWHLIIGSSIELDVFRYEERSPVLLEAGFPCNNHHAVSLMPSYGYAGISAWAQRLLTAAVSSRPG